VALGPTDDPGEVVRRWGNGADLVVECTGDLAVLERAAEWLAAGGRVGLYAVYAASHARLPLALGERAFVRVSPREAEMHERALDALRLGLFDLGTLRTHELPLAEIRHAIDLLERREAIKVVIRLDD
jgi:threonine dehydrogenase-like Zn-dependent dehydrogenase